MFRGDCDTRPGSQTVYVRDPHTTSSGLAAEGGQGSHQCGAEPRSTVAGVVEHDELGIRPGTRKVPRRVQRSRDVVATVHQNGGDTCQASNAIQDSAGSSTSDTATGSRLVLGAQPVLAPRCRL